MERMVRGDGGISVSKGKHQFVNKKRVWLLLLAIFVSVISTIPPQTVHAATKWERWDYQHKIDALESARALLSCIWLVSFGRSWYPSAYGLLRLAHKDELDGKLFINVNSDSYAFVPMLNDDAIGTRACSNENSTGKGMMFAFRPERLGISLNDFLVTADFQNSNSGPDNYNRAKKAISTLTGMPEGAIKAPSAVHKYSGSDADCINSNVKSDGSYDCYEKKVYIDFGALGNPDGAILKYFYISAIFKKRCLDGHEVSVDASSTKEINIVSSDGLSMDKKKYVLPNTWPFRFNEDLASTWAAWFVSSGEVDGKTHHVKIAAYNILNWGGVGTWASPTCSTLADAYNTGAQKFHQFAKDNGGADAPEGPGTAEIGDPAGTDPDNEATCESEGGALGWVACPAYSGIAGAVNSIYNLILDQFNYQTLNQNQAAIEPAWENFRNIANIGFAIVFLIIIYSTAIGGKMS